MTDGQSETTNLALAGEVAVMTSALITVALKLGKLIPLLSSDKTGEVVATCPHCGGELRRRWR